MDLSKLTKKTAHKVTGTESNDNRVIVETLQTMDKDVYLEFNYRDTDDFQHAVPDFTGFCTSVRLYIKKKFKDRSYFVRGRRETGIITIGLIGEKTKPEIA